MTRKKKINIILGICMPTIMASGAICSSLYLTSCSKKPQDYKATWNSYYRVRDNIFASYRKQLKDRQIPDDEITQLVADCQQNFNNDIAAKYELNGTPQTALEAAEYFGYHWIGYDGKSIGIQCADWEMISYYTKKMVQSITNTIHRSKMSSNKQNAVINKITSYVNQSIAYCEKQGLSNEQTLQYLKEHQADILSEFEKDQANEIARDELVSFINDGHLTAKINQVGETFFDTVDTSIGVEELLTPYAPNGSQDGQDVLPVLHGANINNNPLILCTQDGIQSPISDGSMQSVGQYHFRLHAKIVNIDHLDQQVTIKYGADAQYGDSQWLATQWLDNDHNVTYTFHSSPAKDKADAEAAIKAIFGNDIPAVFRLKTYIDPTDQQEHPAMLDTIRALNIKEGVDPVRYDPISTVVVADYNDKTNQPTSATMVPGHTITATVTKISGGLPHNEFDFKLNCLDNGVSNYYDVAARTYTSDEIQTQPSTNPALILEAQAKYKAVDTLGQAYNQEMIDHLSEADFKQTLLLSLNVTGIVLTTASIAFDIVTLVSTLGADAEAWLDLALCGIDLGLSIYSLVETAKVIDKVRSAKGIIETLFEGKARIDNKTLDKYPNFFKSWQTVINFSYDDIEKNKNSQDTIEGYIAQLDEVYAAASEDNEPSDSQVHSFFEYFEPNTNQVAGILEFVVWGASALLFINTVRKSIIAPPGEAMPAMEGIQVVMGIIGLCMTWITFSIDKYM